MVEQLDTSRLERDAPLTSIPVEIRVRRLWIWSSGGMQTRYPEEVLPFIRRAGANPASTTLFGAVAQLVERQFEALRLASAQIRPVPLTPRGGTARHSSFKNWRP